LSTDREFANPKTSGPGFNAATGDILMIRDADLTTMPEKLIYFMDVIASGEAEFVNGSRLVYQCQKQR
jgi:hypothetical protein